MTPELKITLHDMPELQGLARAMRQRAEELAHRFHGLRGCTLDAERVGTEFQMRIEARFSQHQVILSRVGATPEAALAEAVGAAVAEIERLAHRDPTITALSLAA